MKSFSEFRKEREEALNEGLKISAMAGAWAVVEISGMVRKTKVLSLHDNLEEAIKEYKSLSRDFGDTTYNIIDLDTLLHDLKKGAVKKYSFYK